MTRFRGRRHEQVCSRSSLTRDGGGTLIFCSVSVALRARHRPRCRSAIRRPSPRLRLIIPLNTGRMARVRVFSDPARIHARWSLRSTPARPVKPFRLGPPSSVSSPRRPRACHRHRLRSRRHRACRRARLAAPSPPIVSPPSDPITHSPASIVFCPAPTSVAARLTGWDTADRLVLIDAQTGPRYVLLDEATRKLLDELAASASGGGISAEIGVGSSSR